MLHILNLLQSFLKNNEYSHKVRAGSHQLNANVLICSHEGRGKAEACVAGERPLGLVEGLGSFYLSLLIEVLNKYIACHILQLCPLKMSQYTSFSTPCLSLAEVEDKLEELDVYLTEVTLKLQLMKGGTNTCVMIMRLCFVLAYFSLYL